MARPRKLDESSALEAMLDVFWRKGYEGTSYADLVVAAGVERPALYAAFGNKEALFGRALEWYNARHASYIPEALTRATSRQVVEAIFSGVIELCTRDPQRPGCLGVNAALATSDDAEPVRQGLIKWRTDAETALRRRLNAAQAEGDLPADANPAALSAFVQAVAQGMAVQAKSGASRARLSSVARQAMKAWPDKSPASA